MKTPLLQGHYYHIYNRGNNRENIFFETENYYHFLRLYEKYIHPVAETFAWCLLKNHFHLLVYIKEKSEINRDQLEYSTVKEPKTISASKQFSHLFNAYTQAINKRYKRTGSVFENNFERKHIDNESYFQKLILYIHNNPVHHGFTESAIDYPWSSYGSIVSAKPTKLQRNKVLNIFETVENFKYCHSTPQNLETINHLFIE